MNVHNSASWLVYLAIMLVVGRLKAMTQLPSVRHVASTPKARRARLAVFTISGGGDCVSPML